MEDLNRMSDSDKLAYIEAMDNQCCVEDAVIRSVLGIQNELVRQKAVMLLEEKARAISQIRNFQKMVGIIKQEIISELSSNDNTVKLEEDGITLKTGDWICDNQGVHRLTFKNGIPVDEVACWQPIIISNIFFNKEINLYRVQLAFKESETSKVKTVTVAKSMIATASNITALADYGIAVTSITAPNLVRYLNDLERLNVDIIPRCNSISRLGWVNGEFIPYDSDILFDGETMYKELFTSVKPNGDYAKWKEMVLNEITRDNCTEAKMVLGAAFASPLVGLLDKLVYFTHLWGTSGRGKSVALYLAESVWGMPRKLVQNLNGTAVALERLASFFCNVPLCLDELQTLKKASFAKDGGFDDILYKLGQGRGKSRGRKDGSIDNVSTWALSIITTGEEPITTDNSGGGAKNRVIDIYCRENIFGNATNVVNVCNENYGYAGKEFIEKLITFIRTNGKSYLNDIYQRYFEYLMKTAPTDKQAMSASMTVLGYTLMEMFIFNVSEDEAIENGLDMLDDVRPFLIDITQVDNVDNFYMNLLSFVVQNKHHFVFSRKINGAWSTYNPLENRIEVWGKITDTEIDISNIIVKKFCTDNNTSYMKMIRSLAETNKSIALATKGVGDKFEATKPVRINGGLVRCLALKIPSDNEKETIKDGIVALDEDESNSLPF